MRRRSLLASLGATGLAAVAGCGALGGDDTPDEQSSMEYDDLAARNLYLASGVSVSLPADVTEVAAPDEADLVVLQDTTDVGADTGIEWLASGTGVAFVGSEGQSALLDWMESDAYDEAFESRGVGEGSPPPDFMLAFGIDRQYISTYSYTWNDDAGTTDERILDGIEESLHDLQNR